MDGAILAATLPRDACAGAGDAARRARASRSVALGDEEYVALAAAARRRRRGAAAAASRSRSSCARAPSGCASCSAIHTRARPSPRVVAVLLATLAQLRASPARSPGRWRDHRDDARGGRHRRPHPQDRAAPRRALGRRGRAAAGDDVQHADRLDRALPARGGAEGAAVVARPAVDGHRARDPQPADDHQGGAAHAARRRASAPRTLREAVADIDEEIARLNRIVTEVLDFARPIRFELAPPTSTRSAATSAAAALAPASRRRAIALDLDPALPPVTTDAERLRIALVNILVNARHAVDAGAGGGQAIRSSRTARSGDVGAAIIDRRQRHRHRRAETWRASSTRTSPPSAAAPASACRSPRTSSKASAARIAVASAARARAPRSASSCPLRRRPTVAAWTQHDASRLDPARRRRGEDPQGARRARCATRATRWSRPTSPREAQRLLPSARSTCWSSTT